jgi:hypothetical protein
MMPGRGWNIRSAAIAAAQLVAAIATPAAAKDAPPYEYGPVPTLERFQELGEQAVHMRLVDPDSARIRWLGELQQGFYKPMLAKRVHGYYACGLVNARNRMGGYNGDTYFIVVVDYDLVRYVEISENAYSLLGEQCAKAALPPPLPPLKAAPRPTPKSNYGIAFFAAPAGIRVDRVLPGSPAERAGIKEGMIITRVNGLVLRGLTKDMAQQMLAGVTGDAVLELDSGAVITLERP